MTAKWVEIYGESRAFTIDRQNISKDFVFVIYEDDDSQSFADNLTPVFFDGIELFLDDTQIQTEVMRKVRGYIPLYFEFVVSSTKSYILYISTCRVTQLNWGAWEVHMTFDIPENNNQEPNEEDGPDGDDLTDEFVQIAFNGTAVETKIQNALVTECNYSNKIYQDWLAAGSPVARTPKIPYIPNTKALIGHTKDGIEGATVFDRHFSFQITQYMSPEKLKSSYVRRLTRMISTLNDRDFFGFAAGSLMFKGYSGQGDLYKNTPVTFEFDHKPNFIFKRFDKTVLADPEDERDSANKLVTLHQYDKIHEPEFNNTLIGYTTSAKTPAVFNAPNILKNQVIAEAAPDAYNTDLAAGHSAGFSWPYEGINYEIGVHSGWSIISYLYEEKIDTKIGTIRIPSYRIIYQPYEYSNFIDLQL